MSESVYRKTVLPVKLDLNKRNTREQLSQHVDDKRGTLEGVSSSTASSDSLKDCTDVMRKHLKSWLLEHSITGPPPSAEAEQRAMWQWIRDFHKEYSDDWFTRNMPRLKDQFKPLFMQEMKEMKKSSSPAGAGQAGGDLLDMAGSSANKTESKGNDLLGFDDSAPTSTVIEASASVGSDLLGGSETQLAGTMSSGSAGGGLDDILGSNLPAVASSGSNLPAVSSSSGRDSLSELGSVLSSNQPSLPPATSGPPGDGLLGLDLGSFAPAQQTPASVLSSSAGYAQPQLAEQLPQPAAQLPQPAAQMPQPSPTQQPLSQEQLQQLQQLLQQQPAVLAALQQQLQPLAQQQQQMPAASQQMPQPVSQHHPPILQQPILPQQQAPALQQQPQLDPVQQLQGQLQSLSMQSSVAPSASEPAKQAHKEANLFDFNLI